MYRGSNAGFVPPPLHRISYVRASEDSFRTVVYDAPEFPGMPCIKKVYKDKKASVHWSTDKNEERVSSRG